MRTGEQAKGGIVSIVGVKVTVRVGLGVFVAAVVDVDVEVGFLEGVERVFVIVGISVDVARSWGTNDENAV